MADQPLYAPDVVAEQQRIAQQRALAQALMQQQDLGRTQMAGNVAIRNSPVAGIGQMLSSYLGGRMLNQSNQSEKDVNQRRQEAMINALRTGSAQYQNDPSAAAMTFAGNPDTAQYAPIAFRAIEVPKAPELSNTAKEARDLGFDIRTPEGQRQYQEFKAGSQNLTPYQQQMLILERKRVKLAEEAAARGEKPPAGYRWGTNGALEAIAGGPADPKQGHKNAVPTEDERKAAGWYQQAMNAYQNMQAALKEEPGAAKPGLIESIGVLPEAAKNWSKGDTRQKYTQAASSFAEAALRAATGAGVTEAEANQKIRELTPQLGDSDAVIQQKQASLQVYLDSLRSRAARAIPGGASGAGAAGMGGGGTGRFTIEVVQ